MAFTGAERVKRHREKQKQKGLVRKDFWTDRLGFIAPTLGNGGWKRMTLKEFNRGLEKLLADFKADEKEVVYTEVFEYAKRIKGRFVKSLVSKR